LQSTCPTPSPEGDPPIRAAVGLRLRAPAPTWAGVCSAHARTYRTPRPSGRRWKCLGGPSAAGRDRSGRVDAARARALSLSRGRAPKTAGAAGFGNHVAGRALAPRGTGSGSRETTPPDVPSLEGPVVEVRSLGGGRRSPGAWRRRLTGLDAPRGRP